MSESAKNELESLVRKVVLKAATLAADRSAPIDLRRDSAGLAFSIAHHVPPSEAVCADLIDAAFRSIDDADVVRGLLEAVQGVAPDDPNLKFAIKRLCARAFDAGQAESLAVAMRALTGAPAEAADGVVPDGWFVMLSRVPAQRLAYFVCGWFRRFGARQESFRQLIRENQDCMFARVTLLNPKTLLAIHKAQPTAMGWIAIAMRCPDPIEFSFDDQVRSEAIKTLREARDRAPHEAIRERLSTWLERLTAA